MISIDTVIFFPIHSSICTNLNVWILFFYSVRYDLSLLIFTIPLNYQNFLAVGAPVSSSFFQHFLTFWNSKISKLILYFPCPGLESLFLKLKIIFRNHSLYTGYAHDFWCIIIYNFYLICSFLVQRVFEMSGKKYIANNLKSLRYENYYVEKRMYR